MSDPILFHIDLYRRDALECAAQKHQSRARIVLVDDYPHVVAHLEPLDGGDWQTVRDEFCNDAFATTVGRWRDGAPTAHQAPGEVVSDAPPWGLLAPFGEGAELGLGWVIESLSPVRGGAATLLLRHAEQGPANVSIRRNVGAPLGVAHTDHLDFMLMNGGSGAAQTEESIGRVLIRFAQVLREMPAVPAAGGEGAALLPHAEARTPHGQLATIGAPSMHERVTPRIDLAERTIVFEFDEAGVSRVAVYDTMLAFADRCSVFLTRPDANRLGIHVRALAHDSPDAVRVLAAELTRALNHVVRRSGQGGGAAAGDGQAGLPASSRRPVDIDALLDELADADAATLGIGFEPERGPGHENLRVLNIRGTGACNSDCVWCVEKFDPTHRTTPKADSTRQFILDGAGSFDMLFFASGEPTIHPKLFEYVELGRSVGFTSFGMSSHFRTLADPRFALRILQAGFQYFDISLHAADAASQLDVNPIGDGGASLFEALKGLAVLYRLAAALGIRISVTHKIVVSRLNVTALEAVFRATYERGVRHFILQPVRAMNLEPQRQAAVDITEDEIVPHLNELLRRTEFLGAVVKPYGFARQGLFNGDHVEHERNRLKNVYGRDRGGGIHRPLATALKPTADGALWIDVRRSDHDRTRFAADGDAPILDEALARGLDLPFGCRMGSCGMCCARLLDGRVDQRGQIFLTPEQEQQGYVLLCQARALSDVTLQICTQDELDPL